MANPESGHDARPQQTLGLIDAIAMIVGIVIGAGIFRAPSIVAGAVSTDTVFLLLWLAGGLISLVGALCYAELGSAYPNTGGEYFFLTRALGRGTGFLFAWARMSVVQTGAIAAIAFVFGDYASELFSFGAHSSAIWAAIAVVMCTALNVAGTSPGKWLQNALTLALAVGMLAVIAAGLGVSGAPVAPSPPADGPPFSGPALIFILLTYGGWNEAAYLSAEIRDGRRNIVRALVIGLLLVTVLYMLINAAYVQALGLAGMRASKAVAADLVKLAFGDAGKILLALVVMAAALTTLNATVFTGARTNYAVGQDFALFRFLGRWHTSSNAPVAGLLWQGTIALALVGFGSLTPDGFETMVAYTAPAFWLFFLLTGSSLFVLRKQTPLVTDPFRVPLYPVTPVLFCCMCMYMLYSSTSYAMSLNPGSIGAKIGIGVLLVGIPLFFFAQPSAAASVSQQPGSK